MVETVAFQMNQDKKQQRGRESEYPFVQQERPYVVYAEKNSRFGQSCSAVMEPAVSLMSNS